MAATVIDRRTIPAEVRQRWRLDHPETRFVSMSGGLSGTDVYRCDGPTGPQSVLRSWPPSISIARVSEIHHVLETARTHGCRWVPKIILPLGGESAFRCQNSTWDLLGWIPGYPWDVTDLNRDCLDAVQKACSAIGSFHAAVRPMGHSMGAVPAVQARLEKMATLQSWLVSPITSSHASPQWVTAAESLIKSIWFEQGQDLQKQLTSVAKTKFPLQVVLRDVHSGHVLFSKHEISGFIDFDALRTDSPTTDLARFVSSFHRTDREDLWTVALAGYRTICPFSTEEAELARLLEKATLLLSLANWVIWFIEGRNAYRANRSVASARANHLTSCIKAVFGLT